MVFNLIEIEERIEHIVVDIFVDVPCEVKVPTGRLDDRVGHYTIITITTTTTTIVSVCIVPVPIT